MKMKQTKKNNSNKIQFCKLKKYNKRIKKKKYFVLSKKTQKHILQSKEKKIKTIQKNQEKMKEMKNEMKKKVGTIKGRRTEKSIFYSQHFINKNN